MIRFLALLFLLSFVMCKIESKDVSNISECITESYYPNGKLKSTGVTFGENQPIGEWSYYDSTGLLKRKAEYLKIDGKAYLNQDWYFNKIGDTLRSKGSHFDIVFEKDTIFLNEPIKAKINLTAPLFKNKNSEILIVILKDYSINFNKDFSNAKEVELDTTFSLNLEKEIRAAIGITTDFGKYAIFGRYFKSIGNKKFRGIIVEYFYQDSITSDSVRLNYFENKKYFEKDIYVVDSLDTRE